MTSAQRKWTKLKSILTTTAKVSTHINKHFNSELNNEIKKLSDKQKNIKNNQNALNFKEGNQESQQKKKKLNHVSTSPKVKERKGKTN